MKQLKISKKGMVKAIICLSLSNKPNKLGCI